MDPGIGHNQPPQPLDADRLIDWLEIQPELERLRPRHTDLSAAIERFKKAHPTIADDEVQGNAAEFDKQLRVYLTACEDARKKFGRSYLDCTERLNRHFERLRTAVEAGRVVVQNAMNQYARAKQQRERERREAEAEQKRQAAAAAERAARVTGSEQAWDRAVDTGVAADRATKAAQAGVAELSRVRGDQGATVSLVERWDFEVTDPNLVPRQYCLWNAALIRAAITAGAREMPGVRIFDASKVRTR